MLRPAINDSVLSHQPGEMRHAERDPRPLGQMLTQPVERPAAKGMSLFARIGRHCLLEQRHVSLIGLARTASSWPVSQSRDPLLIEPLEDLPHSLGSEFPAGSNLRRRSALSGKQNHLRTANDPCIFSPAD